MGGRGFGARSFAIEELRARFGLDEDVDGAGTRDGEASSWNMARVAGRA